MDLRNSWSIKKSNKQNNPALNQHVWDNFVTIIKSSLLFASLISTPLAFAKGAIDFPAPPEYYLDFTKQRNTASHYTHLDELLTSP